MLELKHGSQIMTQILRLAKTSKLELSQIKEKLFNPYGRPHQQCLMVLHSSNVMPYVPFK